MGLLVLTLAAEVGSPSAGAATPAHAPLAGLPLFFEANCGQASLPVQFVAHSRSGTVLLRPTEVVVLQSAARPLTGLHARAVERGRDPQAEVRTLSFQFVGGNPQAVMTGLDSLSGKINYILGDDPASWRTEVPAFDRVRVAEVYPGVDLVYYGNEQKLEYDLIVAPGADAGAVCLRVTGADRLELDAQGDLVLSVGAAQLRQHKPVLHQIIGGARKEVTGGYRLKDPQTVAFEVGRYDPQCPLIIDPVLSYASYFGGSGNTTAWDVALDGAGNVYVAGATLTAGLATPGAWQTNYAGDFTTYAGDAFVAKFDTTCSNLIYMTYLGGSGYDAAMAIAVDAAGNAYVTGVTDSTNFPTTPNALQTTNTSTPGGIFGLRFFDAFVSKLNPSGSALVYSTLVGGNTNNEGIAIAVDSAGCAYITGFTDSTNFPTTPNALQTQFAGATDAFVCKLGPAGTNFVYSTYLGGTNLDQADGIAVDALGRAWITGVTVSNTFPIVNAIQPWPGGGLDAFVSVIASNGQSLVLSTYLGGAGDDVGYRIVLDANKTTAYVVGTESSSWSYDGSFPITPGGLNPGGVFTSTNAGQNWSWTSAGLLHPQVYSLAVNPVSPNQMYAGTGRGVARSSDGGATWDTTVSTNYAGLTAGGLAAPIAIGHIFALALNPLSPSTLYAGTSQGIYQSLDAGTTWSLTSTGLVISAPGPYVQAIAVDPVTPSTLYAGTSLGVFPSTNAAATWGPSIGLPGYDVRALAIDPQDRATLYAATTTGGVWRSADQGVSWAVMDNGLTNLFCLALALDPQTRSNLYVGTTDGLFKSTNSGNNWTLLFSLSNLGYTNGVRINALALDPATSVLYAGTDQGVFEFANGGTNWIYLTNGLSALPTYALAVNSDLLYAGTIEFPITNTSDAFLTRLDVATGSILTSTTLTGNATNQGWAVAVDRVGNSYVVGVTSSTNFPTVGTEGDLSATNNGDYDVFVTAINADASALLYSAYLGGSGNDFGYGIAADPAGNAYIVGQTASTDFPLVSALQTNLAAVSDAFVAKIQAGTTPSLAAKLLAGRNLQLKWPAFSPYVLETAATLSAPTNAWTAVTNPMPVLSNGCYSVTLPANAAAAFFRLYRP
ncbi:MAG: SBBP repeat-containing protein [Limisphaerales bacterium]